MIDHLKALGIVAIICAQVYAVCFLIWGKPGSDRNPRTMTSGMTDAGIEVSVTGICINGKHYWQGYGAELGEFGAPVPCVFNKEEIRYEHN